jgi:hypothetical protein
MQLLESLAVIEDENAGDVRSTAGLDANSIRDWVDDSQVGVTTDVNHQISDTSEITTSNTASGPNAMTMNISAIPNSIVNAQVPDVPEQVELQQREEPQPEHVEQQQEQLLSDRSTTELASAPNHTIATAPVPALHSHSVELEEELAGDDDEEAAEQLHQEQLHQEQLQQL